MDLKIGDSVQLNSGGPIMKVKAIRDDGVLCWWPGRTAYDHVERVFAPAMLRQPDTALSVIDGGIKTR